MTAPQGPDSAPDTALDASGALLARIASDRALADFLAWPGDFDIERRDPVEDLRLPTGRPLYPIAGCGAGGTYFLCGPPHTAHRPVLYADSEGQATLIGEDLTEAVRLIASFPYWRDLGRGFPPAELEAELQEDHPDLDARRTAVLTTLNLTPLTVPETLTHLHTCATHTAPDHIPTSTEHNEPYDLLLTPPRTPATDAP
ncbi:hypothetical protein ACFVT5_03275 [Streptomyces sp. NPDC058001]|uniref:hypothetical protein n=1 Tax=Streptomyces sp. NPDC058001 TaxID=3346300 RepID=UPI0036EEE35F